MKNNTTTMALASVGALGGLYYAFKKGKGFWGYAGFFVLGSIGKENASSYNSLRASISDTVKQAQEQYEFVKEYISKSKKERKKMFRTVTWFGIPVK